jgi:hypothetical protein
MGRQARQLVVLSRVTSIVIWIVFLYLRSRACIRSVANEFLHDRPLYGTLIDLKEKGQCVQYRKGI